MALVVQTKISFVAIAGQSTQTTPGSTADAFTRALRGRRIEHATSTIFRVVGVARTGKAGLFRRRGIGTRSALFITRAGQVVGVVGVPEEKRKKKKEKKENRREKMNNNTGWSETTGEHGSQPQV